MKMKIVAAVFLSGILFALGMLLALPAFAGTVVLEWGAVNDTDLAGYKVYYSSTNVQPFQGAGATQGAAPLVIPKGTTKATLNGLDITKPYFFAVTAYNTVGAESVYSNIVSIPAPWFPDAPPNLGLKVILYADTLIIQ